MFVVVQLQLEWLRFILNINLVIFFIIAQNVLDWYGNVDYVCRELALAFRSSSRKAGLGIRNHVDLPHLWLAIVMVLVRRIAAASNVRLIKVKPDGLPRVLSVLNKRICLRIVVIQVLNVHLVAIEFCMVVMVMKMVERMVVLLRMHAIHVVPRLIILRPMLR